MFLKDLIAFLEQQPKDKVLPIGFSNPHSYRGYYEDLAFEPAADVSVQHMLEEAKSAVGATYYGWKGGDFTMGEYTDVWLAEKGRTGEGIGPVLLAFMFGDTLALYEQLK